MSRFQTSIPVNVQQLLDALPKNAFVHEHYYDSKEHKLIVHWESEALPTGYNFPVDYPLADLLAKKLPKSVKAQRAIKAQAKAKDAPNQATEPNSATPVATPDHFWDAERLAKEKALGPVEFQGVEPSWKLVDSEHVWQEGFFYRHVAIPKPAESGVDTPLKAS